MTKPERCPHCSQPLTLTAGPHCRERAGVTPAEGPPVCRKVEPTCMWITCARRFNGCGAVIDSRGFHTHEQAQAQTPCAEEKADKP